RLLSLKCCAYRIRHRAAARIAQCGDMVDIHAEAQLCFFRHGSLPLRLTSGRQKRRFKGKSVRPTVKPSKPFAPYQLRPLECKTLYCCEELPVAASESSTAAFFLRAIHLAFNRALRRF